MDFRRGNMLSLDIGVSAWGGIVAFYSIIHVPRMKIPDALAEMKQRPKTGLELNRAFL
jgi:hypothetical protein